MQVEYLPVWVHKELDKAMRKCVRGGVTGERGVHLLDWESLCKPKEMGVANLKSAKDMSRAMMMKLV